MRFRIKETAQDVIVCCCILHNILKSFNKANKEYTANQHQQQLQIGQDLQRLPPQQRIQNYLIDNFFN